MSATTIFSNLDHSRPIEIAEGIWWVGLADEDEDLHCNPYLIVDSGKAVLIDGGSRPDFSTVVRKILQVGISPEDITHLVYQHYDPDLCGSLTNFEDIIRNDDLRVVSKRENNTYIRYYSNRSRMLCIRDLDRKLVLPSGRVLRFVDTPYAHAAGAFVTIDEATGTVFSSDLFGSYSSRDYDGRPWALFVEFEDRCRTCRATCAGEAAPAEHSPACPWTGIARFHQQNMPCRSALRHAMETVRALEPKMLAPQHGSIFHRQDDIEMVMDYLWQLEDVGIDRVLRRRRKS